MIEICKIPNKLSPDSVFWIFPIWDLFASVCFGFRYSDFGFVSLGAWRDNILSLQFGALKEIQNRDKGDKVIP
jgi:hypothetical protein